jgi:uncharacterized protein
MRVPTTEPRRRFHLRGWLIGAVIVLVIFLLSLRGLAGFYTDFLWFDSIGQGSTWSDLLAAKVAPALVFTVVFFVIMLLNLVIADRIAPKYRSMGPEDELIARYQQATSRFTGRIRVGVAMFFALIAGVGVSSKWEQWILFTHRVDFGINDPQFHKDVGFYIFRLPFLEFIFEWLFAGLIVVLIVTAIAHYLNGGIRFQTPFQRVTPQVKAHLSVILAIMALVKTVQYYLARYGLDFSSRGVVNGAGYTDINAKLPALELLMIVSVCAAVLFLWNIHRRGWVLPIIAVGLWAFLSLVVATIYPAVVQQLRVKPNEFAKEAPYIKRNINATRAAFGLDRVERDNFDFTQFSDVADANQVIDSNKGTIDNARLWDPEVIQATYAAQEQIQTYYRIGDVDVDRYLVDGETRQVLIAARELNSADLPSQSFVNRHAVYTHGYGLVASPSNEAQSDGGPDFYLSKVPTVSNGIDLQQGSPSELYYGENLDDYVLVDAQAREFNYQAAGRRDVFTRYQGDDGVVLSNPIKRAAFALRFGDPNLLISGQVNSKTRVLMARDIRQRVTKLAPFLEFDADPYPVVLPDRTLWVLDAYTATDSYPYSQTTSGEGGLAADFNYVRNSVKATVDAYDGTVTFYVFDASDPLIKSWRKAFPNLFTDASQMPDQLRAHLRYPEDLFRAQANVLGTYHVTEARRFYDANAKWLISPDPGSGFIGSNELTGVSGTIPQAPTNQPQAAASTGRRIDPYYLYLKLPGDDDASFIAVEPFVPVSAGNSINRLASFLTAKSDPGQYGELQVFDMPEGSSVLGPVQVNNEINRTSQISSAVTLLNKENSRVIRGSMQLIPVGNSIIYVRPFYVQGTGEGGFPQFQFVAVYSQGKGAVCARTVSDGLDQLFDRVPEENDCTALTQTAATPTNPPTTSEPGSSTTTTTAPPSSTTVVPPATGGSTVEDLLAQATVKLDQADQVLRSTGDLGQYQRLVTEAKALIQQAQQLGGP